MLTERDHELFFPKGEPTDWWWVFLHAPDEGWAIGAAEVAKAAAAQTLGLVIIEQANEYSDDICCRFTALGNLIRTQLMGAGPPGKQLVREPDYDGHVDDLLSRWPNMGVDEVVDAGMSACGGKANPEGFSQAFHKRKRK